MSDQLEKRVEALEARLAAMEPHVSRMIPLGPGSERSREIEKHQSEAMRKICEGIRDKKDANERIETPPVDRSAQQLTDGSPVPEDRNHTELKENGQQKGYVVLTPEERAKGFVRPVRQRYIHVGPLGPKYPLRDLDPVEDKHHIEFGYVKSEPYPESESPLSGRMWMQAQLDAVGNGCGTRTTMGLALAETYARDPKFYGGTFCCGCGKHFPVDEFIWDDGSQERVGS